ncbi:tetratricopeptide repeat protein [Mesonia ostreae]|uniref:Tetratricopeptide repeat protein n=1 Tax=Mesonia ostreae TaxID=861110 RepID=A0ABU2KLD5_9FLAO|nr:tetratricopeptide repeat protein [Mesonia ostreae]MDT0295541.1 tetratricopeptide repeat protein [Mesonia ostreae]
MRSIFFLVVWTSFSMNAQNSFNEGVQHVKADNFTEALLDFNKVTDAEENYWEAQEHIADIYSHQKKWNEAVEIYEVLVENFPQSASHNFKYGGALGMKALSLSKMQAAFYISDIKFHLKKAAELDPNHIEARWALTKLYMQLPGILGGSTATSYEYTDQLLKISPVDGWLSKGYVASEDENYKAAENYYKKALEVGGSVTCYTKLIQLYEEKLSKREEAQQLRKEAQKQHPTHNWTKN